MSERARFAPGATVRVRATDPRHHTRVPRYARGHTGRVVDVTGRWPLADDVALRRAEPRVETVYTVAFAARELWGAQERTDEYRDEYPDEHVDEGEHEVLLDLWESYLEPCGPGPESGEEDGS